jgi:hypothetical protein
MRIFMVMEWERLLLAEWVEMGRRLGIGDLGLLDSIVGGAGVPGGSEEVEEEREGGEDGGGEGGEEEC